MISVLAVNGCSIFRSSPPISACRCRFNSHFRTTSSLHYDRYSKSGSGFPIFRFDLLIMGHGDVRSYSLHSFVDMVLEELASYSKRRRSRVCSAIKLTTGGEVLDDKLVKQAVEEGLLVEFKKDSGRVSLAVVQRRDGKKNWMVYDQKEQYPIPPSEIQIGVNSRKGGNNSIIHPVEIDTSTHQVLPAMASPSSPTSVVYREVKHFKKWWTWLIPAFVIANVVMFIITMYVNNCPKKSVSCIARFLGRFSFQPFKENPLLGPSSITLQKMGALDVQKVVDGHQGWRLITCNWLHGGVFHLLANMLSLLVIGIRLEQEFGFVKVGLLYVISGFGGSLLSALFIQSNISVGASGALFGLLGGMLSELITNWTIYASKVAAFITLVAIIVINLAVGILPHVDNFAHIGGFLSGFLLGFVFLIRPQFGWFNQRHAPLGYIPASVKSKFKTYQCALWIISLILLIVGFTIGLVLLLRGVDANEHCSWCHYLSCIPTAKWSCKTEPAYCLSTQIGNQLNLTCSSNGKSSMYILPGATSSQIQGLCTDLCR